MAILIKDFNWKQTESNVLIQLPLNGIHKSKVDIFTSEKFIKASYPPFIFEAFLLHPISVQDSQCTLSDKEITFTLKKLDESCNWERLEDEMTRKEKLTRKNEAIEESVRKGEEERNAKINKKAELKRTAVRASIELDTKNRNVLEAIKESEKKKALKEIEIFRDKTLSGSGRARIVELSDSEEEEEEKRQKQQQKKSLKTAQVPTKKPIAKSDPIPLPRKSTRVEVTFTPREFPTPSRESQLQEEEEWLRNQLDARKSAGFVSEDLRPEEKNPQWLKDKGDEFLKAKNYLGAISAYSFGIKLSDKFVDFYVQRSKAHYALGNLHKCITDCSKALELMVPAVPANLEDRARCLARRGNVLSKLGVHREAVNELQAALRLLPKDKEISRDLDNAQICLASNTELD